MVSHVVFAFCSVVGSCETAPTVSGLGLLPALVWSLLAHLMVFPESYSTDCSMPLQWPGPLAVTEKPAPPTVNLPPTVPGQFQTYGQAANSGKIKKYLNCEIQLSLASASEQSFPCPVKSPHGFVRRHDNNALWCTPYRTARHGKPMTISSSYIIHWHDFMLASLAVLVIFYWGESSSILQFASHHGSSYPQNFSFSLSIYLHPDRAVGCS